MDSILQSEISPQMFTTPENVEYSSALSLQNCGVNEIKTGRVRIVTNKASRQMGRNYGIRLTLFLE